MSLISTKANTIAKRSCKLYSGIILRPFISRQLNFDYGRPKFRNVSVIKNWLGLGPMAMPRSSFGIDDFTIRPRSSVMLNACRYFSSEAASVEGNTFDTCTASLKDNYLELHAENGKDLMKFHYIWLRDHCQCSQCFHPGTYQRQVDTFKIPLDIKPKAAKIEHGVLHLTWEDDHETSFDLNWLHDNKYEQQTYDAFDIPDIEKILWQSEISSSLPEDSVFSEVVQDDSKLLEMLEKIVRYGFVFISGITPASVEGVQAVAERIGIIRESLFGGMWESTSGSAQYADTAYLPVALNGHNDGTYWLESPGLQMLHCDKHDGEGGDNLFVDAFRAAEQLRKNDKDAFDFLSSVNIPSQYYGDAELYKCLGPIIKLDPFTGRIFHIRINNDDRDILKSLSFDDVGKFYNALNKFCAILRDPANEFWVKLTSGRLVIFDNWRLLHGRSGFTGIRTMSGCYMNKDEFLSRIRILREQLS